jgi:hypothetical protein
MALTAGDINFFHFKATTISSPSGFFTMQLLFPHLFIIFWPVAVHANYSSPIKRRGQERVGNPYFDLI